MAKRIDPQSTRKRSKGQGQLSRKKITAGPAQSRFAQTGDDENELVKITSRGRMTRNILNELGMLTKKILSNPDKIDLRTYKNMWETDESIQSGVEFISLSALSMLGAYSHEEEKIQEAVRQEIIGLEDGWLQFWDEIITDGCVYGFGNAEVCLETDTEDGTVENLKTRIKGLIGVSPLSGKFQFDLTNGSPTYGDIEGFIQWPDTSYEKLLPAKKLITWSHKSRHGNAYGTSRLKCIWKNWVIKDQMLKSWALTMDRSGSPITWIKCENPDQMIIDPDSGTEIARADFFLDMLDDIENVNGFVVGPNDDVGQQQVARSVGSDFKIIVDHMNGMIFRGLLIPILLLDTSDVGSNALAQQHFKIYVMAMSRIMQMIIPIVIRSAIKPFIIANFGKQKNYGSFSVKELAEESLKIISDIFYSMTQEGYMSSKHKKDMDTVREKLNIPPMSEKEFEEFLKIKKEEEEAAKPQMMPGQPGALKPGGKAPGGRKGNPSGPQAEKPGTRPAAKPPSKKQGRPKS